MKEEVKRQMRQFPSLYGEPAVEDTVVDSYAADVIDEPFDSDWGNQVNAISGMLAF